MRKLKACIDIKAPVSQVRDLAGSGRDRWMVNHDSIWLRTLMETWDATATHDGTRFTLQREYKARLPFLEPLMADGYQQSVTHSLSRLKQLAEGAPPAAH